MLVTGIILMIAGAGMFIGGNAQNNNAEAQLESLFSNGSINPGDTLLYIGIAAFVIGVILTIVGAVRKKKK